MEDLNLWKVIAIDDFKVPSAPTVTKVREQWGKILRLFNNQEDESEEDKNDKELPEDNEFNQKPAIDALENHFSEWLEKKESTVCFLLDPPFSGTSDIAKGWAKQKKWKSLIPPDINEIKNADIDGWWEKQNTKTRWLIDDLACYLIRTADGMSFIRALLPRMLYGDFGQGLLVCDSWMFAFIQRLWQSRLPRVYCFAAAGVELLKQTGIHGTEKSLRKLAVRVRGNFGVALSVWRLKRKQDRKPPELPGDVDDISALLLYSILLHRGLSVDLLREILPMISSEKLNAQLLRLEQFGILKYTEGKWKINVVAYPAVRDFLSSRNFLLDAF